MSLDQDVLSHFMIRKEVSKIISRGVIQTKEAILNNAIAILKVYREKCAS